MSGRELPERVYFPGLPVVAPCAGGCGALVSPRYGGYWRCRWCRRRERGSEAKAT